MQILVSTLSHSCAYGGALYALDLERHLCRTYWYHTPTVAAYPKAAQSHRGKFNHGLTGLCWHGTRLYVARWSDILVVEPRGGFPPDRFEVVDVITHPLFNDLHDIRADGEDLLVVSTGVETILLLNKQGNELATWHVGNGKQSQSNRRCREDAYNKFSSTKPHVYHTNMAVRHQGVIYATLCNSGEIVRLGANRPEIVVNGLKMPHDGEFINGGHNFVATSAETSEFHFFDVVGNSISERTRMQLPCNRDGKGWLRGLLQIDSDRFLLGMSVHKQSRRFHQARLFEVDITKKRILRHWQIPTIYDCPDTKYRGNSGRILHHILRPFRMPFYRHSNVYKILKWQA